MNSHFLRSVMTLSLFCSSLNAAGAQSGATTYDTSNPCEIKTVDPHVSPEPTAVKSDAPDVLSTLQKIVKAYSSGDLKSYDALLDSDATYFDYENNKMIVGKANVVEHLKNSFAKHAKNGSQPLLSYTIDQPYIKVCGQTAVITYRAFEEIGGANPGKQAGLINKTFVKTDAGWKQLHDSSSWHRL